MFISGLLIRRGLLVTYSIFIGMGLVMTGYGIYLAATTTVDLNDVDSLEVNGFTGIMGGLVDVIIGVFGILGVLYHRKILLMIIVFLLAGAIVMNMLIMVVTITATNSASKTSKTQIRNALMKQFGDNTKHSSKEFTLDIENHQKTAQCCGFSDDESENLFLKTPWYAHVNVNTQKKRTLPDSCCLETGPNCKEAENLKEAREKKYVFQYDCMSKLISAAIMNMWLTIFQMLTASILQGLCIAATVLRLIEPSTDAE